MPDSALEWREIIERNHENGTTFFLIGLPFKKGSRSLLCRHLFILIFGLMSSLYWNKNKLPLPQKQPTQIQIAAGSQWSAKNPKIVNYSLIMITTFKSLFPIQLLITVYKYFDRKKEFLLSKCFKARGEPIEACVHYFLVNELGKTGHS